MGITSIRILYLIDENSFLYYGDAVSHLYSARRFVDFNDPGIIQMETVWLPLPHLMMLPFSLVDALFSSGFAGLVNLLLHALTSVLSLQNNLNINQKTMDCNRWRIALCIKPKLVIFRNHCDD